MAVKKPAAKKRIGRPNGKRSNPEFRQASLWLRKDTLDSVLRELVVDGKRVELSHLVQGLLDNWLSGGRKLPKTS